MPHGVLRFAAFAAQEWLWLQTVQLWLHTVQLWLHCSYCGWVLTPCVSWNLAIFTKVQHPVVSILRVFLMYTAPVLSAQAYKPMCRNTRTYIPHPHCQPLTHARTGICACMHSSNLCGAHDLAHLWCLHYTQHRATLALCLHTRLCACLRVRACVCMRVLVCTGRHAAPVRQAGGGAAARHQWRAPAGRPTPHARSVRPPAWGCTGVGVCTCVCVLILNVPQVG